jgi:hypothetical protein
VSHVLALAETWVRWDGRPVPADDHEYTPHVAIRRAADRLVSPCTRRALAGLPAQSDRWRGSTMTTLADLAPFPAEDLDEARSRLDRLGQLSRRRRSSSSRRSDRDLAYVPMPRPGSTITVFVSRSKPRYAQGTLV